MKKLERIIRIFLSVILAVALPLSGLAETVEDAAPVEAAEPAPVEAVEPAPVEVVEPAPAEEPAAPAEAPAEPTEAPAEPTEAPAEPTEAPVEPTEAPAEPTEAPAEPTEAPAEPTEAPAEPVEQPDAPVEQPDAPVEEPAEPTEAPAQPTEAPAEAEPAQGWYQYPDGQFSYILGDALIVNAIFEIDGVWYGFDEYGIMYADEEFTRYDEASGETYHYRAKENGELYMKEWYVSDAGDWYYYDEYGRMATGLVEVEGKLYCLAEDGKLYRDATVTVDGAVYLCGADGVAVKQEDDGAATIALDEPLPAAVEDGWKDADGYWYYYQDGEMLVDAVELIEGSYYGFDENGRMYDNQEFEHLDYEEYYSYHTYRAKKGGALYVNTWYQDKEYGTYYYYGEGGVRAEDTVLQIAGAYYGFDYDGVMHDDERFYCSGSYYRAKPGGALYVNEWYSEEYGGRYYYGEGGMTFEGIVELDSTLYYFYSDGQLCTYENIVEYEGETYFVNSEGVAQKLSLREGWNDIVDGRWIYIKNGERLTNTVAEIGGKYYGFDYDGWMYDDEVFSMWDENYGHTVYYCAKPDGALYQNEWYEKEDWNGTRRSYFGADCVAAEGLTQIGGKLYYFTGTYPPPYLCNYTTVVTDGGLRYFVGKDGIAVRINGDGWLQPAGSADWYYVRDGELLRSTVTQIGPFYYGFDSSGLMYTNQRFSGYFMLDSGEEELHHFYAPETGRLYVNQWYHDPDGSWYYYKDGGIGAEDEIVRIGGKLYYFDWDGMWRTEPGVINWEGANYLIGSDGVVTELSNLKNGWNLLGSDWYYVQDGDFLRETVFRAADGRYFGVDEDGRMYDDEAFSLFEEDDRYYYRAKPGGELYMSAWVNAEGRRYYYGANGRAARDYCEIDGQGYYFQYYGYLYSWQTIVTSREGDHYFVDNDGTATKLAPGDGWKSYKYGWLYIKNGGVLRSTVEYIADGTPGYYAFDYNGRMIDDEEYSIYVSGQGYNYYRARKGGKLYANEWYAYGDSWLYYGEAGAMAQGLQQIGGKLYYFEAYSGGYDYYSNYPRYLMVKNRYVTAGGVTYWADANGACTKVENGWRQLDGKRWKYIRNGQELRGGPHTIGNAKYLFDESGYMYTNVVAWSDTDECYYICQPANGIYTTPGWKSFNGEWYYVKAGGALYEGLLTIGNGMYYMTPEMRMYNGATVIDGAIYVPAGGGSGTLRKVTRDGVYSVDYDTYYVKNGQIVKNQWVQLSNGAWNYYDGSGCRLEGCTETISGKLYGFDTDGRMFANGFVNLYGDMVYADANGALATGSTLINGKWYYFNEEGYMQTGEVSYGGKKHLYDKNGVWLFEIKGDGWYSSNGSYYYVQDGHAVFDDIVWVGGKLYLLDSDGVMLRNRYVRFEGYHEDHYYRALILDANGAARTGWISYNNSWYYGDPETGDLYFAEEYTIANGIYRFDFYGRMVTGDYVEDDKLYRYGSNGARTGVYQLNNGWTNIDGESYYYQNGKPVTGWVGDYYVRNGRMLSDERVEINGYLYQFDMFGRYCHNGWIDNYAYAYSNGRLARNEWVQIGGAKYYFDEYGDKVTYVWYDEEMDVDYYFDSDGKYLGTEEELMASSNSSTTWVQRGNEWYYTYENYYLHDTVARINDVWYYFDHLGRMVHDEFKWCEVNGLSSGWHYFGANGAMHTQAGWLKVEYNDYRGDWYYLDTNYCAIEWGLHKIDGKWYYFEQYGDEPGWMVTGFWTVNGELCNFGANGALVENWTPGVTNGWKQFDGIWYYYLDGSVVCSDVVMIGGKMYGFDYDGWMVENSTVYCDSADGLFYAGDNGVIVTAGGWHQVDLYGDSVWIYVGAGGLLYRGGTYTIGGRSYTFDWDGRWIT